MLRAFIRGVFEPVPEQYLLFVTTDGFAKRVRLEELSAQKCGGVGTIGIKFDSPNSKLCRVVLLAPKARVQAFTESYEDILFEPEEIPIQSLSDPGIWLPNVLGEKDRLVELLGSQRISFVQLRFDEN
jgi:DNA gyrase/topoisomerase IV subunit A